MRSSFCIGDRVCIDGPFWAICAVYDGTCRGSLEPHTRVEVGSVIDVRAADFPWLSGTWTPTAEFDVVAPLFRQQLELANALNDEADEWEAAYTKIRQAVTLHYPDGRVVPEFLLHIDGDEAWFRWSDEPFT